MVDQTGHLAGFLMELTVGFQQIHKRGLAAILRAARAMQPLAQLAAIVARHRVGVQALALRHSRAQLGTPIGMGLNGIVQIHTQRGTTIPTTAKATASTAAQSLGRWVPLHGPAQSARAAPQPVHGGPWRFVHRRA